MRKLFVIFSGILVAALISILTISPAQANIQEWTWLPPYIEKSARVVIYRHGSTARLEVPVYNDVYRNGLNVSKVIIDFDWGRNKTLDLSTNIQQVGWHETEIFTVSFTADAAEAVSSDWAHTYTILVEHVNATTGPTRIVGTWSRAWDWFNGYRFVVFSTAQADALDLSREYDSYASAYPSSYFTNASASQLRGQAVIEASFGDTYYNRGEYDSAKTQYQTALDLYNQALTAENEWRTQLGEAELDVILTEAAAIMTEAKAMLREADAAVNQSYAWMFFGIGFMFMGIATIIYAFRKPKAA